MHEYDVAFKLTLQDVDLTLRALTGTAIARWLNVELPEVRNARVDLLGETVEGDLVHIELQSSNDSAMPLRMAEYCLQVFRLFRRFPRQVLLYAGEAPLSMETELNGPALKYSYQLVDVRELDGKRLLESSRVGDNIVAILTALPDATAAIHRVIERIAGLPAGEREAALGRLLILAGLRKLGRVVEEEARKMPILNDILDHEVLGREYRKGLEQGVQQGLQQGVQQGLQQGVQQGLQQGLQQGVQQGELKVLRRLIEEKFGTVPDWAQQRLSALPAAELEDLTVRVLKASAIEELFR